ncbi:MAG: bifunctional DNA-formamidopyrimidine glycosylase/DNA-(apurinic or apyrimidinic site) lyase [Alphaproteobacteria bacterium]|nr:bifunctional DNA-formamidopyrimidine glycosylase/DNA-(apurinic or apyrimidinic site) lyase [Alphaproteobacteria bacterium]
MPELPEVETVRRGLQPHLEGHRLKRVTVRRPDLRAPVPPDLAARLEGRCVRALARCGKYLLWHFEGGDVLLQHLGMSGRLSVFTKPPPAPSPHDHVDFETEAGACIRFRDPRRFGLLVLSEETALAAHPLLRAMGLDPLSEGFQATALLAGLKGRSGPLKTALLDQHLIAGLGNIYACESLYWAGLSPRRRASSLGPGRAGRLVAAIRRVLDRAIAAGGTSLRDHAQPSGELGYFQHHFAVYDREGAPCPACDCKGGVRRIRQAGRSTFYCPKRQR